jgi:hypothetical protein
VVTIRDSWSHWLLCLNLIQQVRPGDIVFHYFMPLQSFVGSSLAKGNCKQRGNSYIVELERLSGFQVPLKLSDVRDDTRWIKAWINRKRDRFPVLGILFSNHGKDVRTAQAYLTKMPLKFVERWEPLKGAMHHLCFGEAKLSDHPWSRNCYDSSVKIAHDTK